MGSDTKSFNRLFIVYVVCSLAAVFYLPLLVAVAPSTSPSYLFGYNNRAGIALLLTAVVLGAVWAKGLRLQFLHASCSRRVPPGILAGCVAAICCGCLLMYLFAGRYGGFGESSYGIDRAWLLSQGKVPNVDFEWTYGALFIYGPVFIQRLLPITIAQAYYIFWALNFVIGTLLLCEVVDLVNYPTGSKKSIFLLLFVSGFPAIICMGASYTFLRYVCPLFFILIFQKVWSSDRGWSSAKAVSCAAAFAAVLVLISPETAIAFSFASLCICLLPIPGSRRKPVSAQVGLFAVLAVVFLAAARLHALDMLRDAGSGANSFPIFAAPHILFFFAALFVCACYVFWRFSQGERVDNTIGLIAYSIPMLAAALGRCDPGHVFWNGEGIVLASMLYVSNHELAWKWYRGTFLTIAVLTTLTGLLCYLPFFGRVRIGDGWRNDPQEKVDFRSLYPSWHRTFLAPLGYKPNGLGSYLSQEVDYGYFEAFLDADTEAAIQVKVAEIKNHPEKALLLPDHFERACQVSPSGQKVVISVLFGFPYFGHAVHPQSIVEPVCDYILRNYRLEQSPNPQNFGYGLWVAKSGEQATLRSD